MDCAEIKVEMAQEEQQERLIITEEGDMADDRGEEEEIQEETASKVSLGDKHAGEVVVTEPGRAESVEDGQNGGTTRGHEDEDVTQSEPNVDFKRSNLPEDPKTAHRLTPDFPEALYELLCTLQEGRRLNDQRCSFRLESGMRRRCHSEPNTSKPANRVVFSSMTSLQKEEFFELVATAQARRLNDQRAQLEKKPKSRGFRGSLKQISFVRRQAAGPAPDPVPVPVPKEDLYNMILTTQAQGRLEDQRSRAPGPMDDEDFFSLLLRVQGGRMDEQRTELPCLLQT